MTPPYGPPADIDQQKQARLAAIQGIAGNMPLGIARQDALPPGLARMDQLPPGLMNRPEAPQMPVTPAPQSNTTAQPQVMPEQAQAEPRSFRPMPTQAQGMPRRPMNPMQRWGMADNSAMQRMQRMNAVRRPIY